MCGLCLGAYGLLDGAAPGPLGLPALGVGSVLCCLGLAVGSRRVGCSQYRPDPWKAPEWIVAVCGMVPAVVLVAGPGLGVAGLNPTVTPLAWPSMPLLPALAIAVAAVAAVAAPPPVRMAAVRAVRRPSVPEHPPGCPGRPPPSPARRGTGMIEFDHVQRHLCGVATPGHPRNACLRVDEGELALVVGRTGVGKSTLLGAVNGLVPHFTGGTLAGRVLVDGRRPVTHRPRELADVVGVVGQDPLSGFVTDTVEEELAYAMEQLAVPPTSCASGSRRRSTSWASPTSATGPSSSCRVASSSGWPSARC